MTDGLTVKYGSFLLTGTDANGVLWRVFDPITGWDGSPASTLALTQRPRSPGAFIGPRPQLTARTIVINGLIDAPSADTLQLACDALVAAVPLTSKKLSITRGVTTRHLTVYRQDQVLINEEHETLADYSLQCVAPDPRKLDTMLSASTHLPSLSGGLTIPFTIPFTLASTFNPGGITLTNDGIVSGPLSMRIDGPVDGPSVAHVNANGVQKLISLPNLSLSAGEYLLIGDVDSQYVLQNGRTPRDAFLVSRQWFSFEPGVNTFTFSANTPDVAPLLTVYGTPAY